MIYFDKDCEPASDIVVLKVIDIDTLSSKKGGFVLSDEVLRDLRVGFYQILKIGQEAKEKTGLDVGAYVFADKLASFYHTEPTVLMRYPALIMETNLEKTKYRALGGRVIVQEVKSEDEKENSFVIPTSDELRIGVIKSITPPYRKEGEKEYEIPFKVGDKILLTKDERDTLNGFCGDKDLEPTLPIYIYKTDCIICKINED